MKSKGWGWASPWEQWVYRWTEDFKTDCVQGYCALIVERERKSNRECVKAGQCAEDCIEVYTYMHLCSD